MSGSPQSKPSGKTKQSAPPKLGRPSLYSEEIAEIICSRISNGETLLDICAEEGMPGRNTVLGWLKLHDNFRTSYREARERQGDHTYDRMKQIENDVLKGAIDPQAARVVLWSSQWRAARICPKNYSEKVITEHSGPDGGAIQLQATVLDASSMTAEERETMRQILLAAQARKETADGQS